MRREKTTSTRPRGEPITPCRPKEPAPAVQHTGQNKRPQRFQCKNPIFKKRRGRKGEKPAATLGRRGEERAVPYPLQQPKPTQSRNQQNKGGDGVGAHAIQQTNTPRFLSPHSSPRLSPPAQQSPPLHTKNFLFRLAPPHIIRAGRPAGSSRMGSVSRG